MFETFPQATQAEPELAGLLSPQDLRFLGALDAVASQSLRDRQRVVATLRDLDDVIEFLDGDEPAMVFQPILDLSSGVVTSYEALARFSRGAGPDAWFARAHALGLGTELEVKAADAGLRALRLLPAGASLAINVSAATLCSGHLVEALVGVPLHRVVLELTEHEAIDDYEAVITAIEPLRAAGLRLAIDDAGAGSAGVAHLIKLHPDVIKLDRSIVSGIDACRQSLAIASAVVALARHRDATVIAEGVETIAELDAIRRIGVTYGQGWLFGRPNPLDLDSSRAPRGRSYG